MKPTLKHAKALHEAGFKLCKLHSNSKRPIGDSWNVNTVKTFDGKATGYGFPLALNGRCSIDPDNLQAARKGIRSLLQVELDNLMAAGVRTRSTREGSGGRSMFKAHEDLRWIVFRTKESGTILELRAHSPNLQDVVPGLVYLDKDGNECTQTYDDEQSTYLAGKKLPGVLFQWWIRMSNDIEYLREQQIAFAHALGETPLVAMGSEGDPLPFKPGMRSLRQWFNARHDVADMLREHGYIEHDEGVFAHPMATGAPGCKEIAGKEGLWFSHHAGDPLQGQFDAWTAFVVLEHDGDAVTAEKAVAGECSADLVAEALEGFPDLEEEDAAAEEEDWIGVSEEEEAEFEATKAEELTPSGPHYLSNDMIPKDMDAAIRYFNRIYFMISKSEVSVCHWDDGPYGRELVYQKREAFRLTHEHVKRPVEEVDGRSGEAKTKMKQVAVEWLAHPDRTAYYKVVMDPNRPPGGDNGVLNLWSGWAVEAAPAPNKRAEKGVQVILDHIRDVLSGGEDEYCNTYILDWIARMFQYPAVPAGSAVVFRSDQGTGKSVIGTFLARITGSHGLHTSRSEDLVGKFNGILEGKIFVFADEAMFAGNPANTGPLKNMVTADVCTIERKGLESVTRPQSLHIMMATNEDWAVNVEGSDRRYAVFQTSNAKVGDRAYFNTLWAAVDDRDVQAAFLDTMLRRKITTLPGDIPQTQARSEQKLYGLRGFNAWVMDLINDIAGWEEDEGIPAAELEDGRTIVATAWLWEHYDSWYEGHKDRNVRGRKLPRARSKVRKVRSFPDALEGLGFVATGQRRALDRQRGWIIPDTDELQGRLVQ